MGEAHDRLEIGSHLKGCGERDLSLPPIYAKEKVTEESAENFVLQERVHHLHGVLRHG